MSFNDMNLSRPLLKVGNSKKFICYLVNLINLEVYMFVKKNLVNLYAGTECNELCGANSDSEVLYSSCSSRKGYLRVCRDGDRFVVYFWLEAP